MQARPDRLEDLIALNRALPAGADGLHPETSSPASTAASASSIRTRSLEKVLAQHLRHHGVPGAGDADGAGRRRLHAGRRRPAAPRDGQEEGRGDGPAARRSSSRARRRTASREAKANEIFDTMEKFAGYGFNKSHAAAYSLVAYQTAWLKATTRRPSWRRRCRRKWPTPTRCSSSTTTPGTTASTFLPPDINAGGIRFAPVDAQDHPLRPRRHQGHRRAALAVILKARDARRAVHRPVRFLPPRRQARGQSPRRSRR